MSDLSPAYRFVLEMELLHAERQRRDVQLAIEYLRERLGHCRGSHSLVPNEPVRAVQTLSEVETQKAQA